MLPASFRNKSEDIADGSAKHAKKRERICGVGFHALPGVTILKKGNPAGFSCPFAFLAGKISLDHCARATVRSSNWIDVPANGMPQTEGRPAGDSAVSARETCHTLGSGLP